MTIQTIDHRLSEIFGDHLEQFHHILEQTQAVISGGFLLQCLLGQSWKGSDIDLYLNNHQDRSRQLETFLQKEMHSDLHEIISYRFRKQCDNQITEHTLPGGTRLQVIRIKIDPSPPNFMVHFIRSSFDFDVCMNLYAITDHTKTLSCYALNGIMNYLFS